MTQPNETIAHRCPDQRLTDAITGYLDTCGYQVRTVVIDLSCAPWYDYAAIVTITPEDDVHAIEADVKLRTDVFLTGYRYAWSDALSLISDRRTAINKACQRPG
jgi:hypothetical protein